MKKYTMHYRKTRNSAKHYVCEVTANSISEAIEEFYSIYPKYHIVIGTIVE